MCVLENGSVFTQPWGRHTSAGLESAFTKPKSQQLAKRFSGYLLIKNQIKPQQMSCVLRDSTISLKEKRKEHISLSEPPTVKGISRSKMSCLKGSTVNACRIFSSLLSVSTSAGRQHHVSVPKDAVVVQVSRAEC